MHKQYKVAEGGILLIQESCDTQDNRDRLQRAFERAPDAVGVLMCSETQNTPETQHMAEIGYVDLLCTEAARILGIVFSKQILRDSGFLNPTLGDWQLYELLCRLVKVKGTALFTCVLGSGKPLDLQEMSFVYAYLFRAHMDALHRLGQTEQAFMGICRMMQENGVLTQFKQYMDVFLAEEPEYERIAGYTAPYVVLRGDDTCGGVLQQFADDLTDSLTECGQAVLEIGLAETDYDKMQGMLCKGIIGFQTRALEIDFFKKMHGPKFQFWFDNPLRFKGVLRNLPQDQYVLCQDADHAQLIRTYYNTPNAIQFPPGGMKPSQSAMRDQSMRPYDVIFVGRYFPDDADRLTDHQRQFYQFMLIHSGLTFEEGLLQWNPNLKGKSGEEFVTEMEQYRPACRSVIGYFRTKVITTLLKGGIEVHVYGTDWEELKEREKQDYPSLVIHPEVSMLDSREEFAKAKIGLNIMSWYKSGMTERIANIMLSGAVCLSDETTYLRAHTNPGEELELYRLTELDGLPEQIRLLLQDNQRRERIARSGYQKALAEFSWDARSTQLITLAETFWENL